MLTADYSYLIIDVISHVDSEIILLTIDGETLETTAEHPFYVMEAAPWLHIGQVAGRWVDAGELELGGDVRRIDGSTGDVESVVVVPVQQWMYNLTVETAHTFFVGQQRWLVHNAGPCGYARGTALSALTPDRLQHASRHLTDAGILPNWSKKTGQQFVELATNILENPTNVFNHTLGGTQVRGFSGMVSDTDVVIFVFQEGPKAGKVATSMVPSPQQIINWGRAR